MADQQDPPRVTLHMGYTNNLGNFESLRIDVGIEDSRRSNETVDDTFARLYEKLEGKLVEFVLETRKKLNG